MTEFENNQVESGNESMEAALDNFQEVKVGDLKLAWFKNHLVTF